jgi:hypothetical protein
MQKEQIYSDALCLNIKPEMRARLNRYIAERCGRYAKTAPVVRDLLNASLTYFGYPEAQEPPAQPQPASMPSPFAQAPPMNGVPTCPAVKN